MHREAHERAQSMQRHACVRCCHPGRGGDPPPAEGLDHDIRHVFAPLHDTDRRSARGERGVSERRPTTPDGRYFIVGGRLWRSTNPAIPEAKRHQLVGELMNARRAVRDAKRGSGGLRAARARVDSAKVALGERGPVWWEDGAPDWNCHLAKNTPYAEWAGKLKRCGSET